MGDALDPIYRALMISGRLTVTFDARDPVRLARFWAGMLAREAVGGRGAVLVPGDESQLGLGFAPSLTEQDGPNRMHPHLTSTTPADQQRQVAMALELGAVARDVGQRPDEEHVVLADPEGNAFCVIEPGNAFLAGCGQLGELACDGTR